MIIEKAFLNEADMETITTDCTTYWVDHVLLNDICMIHRVLRTNH